MYLRNSVFHLYPLQTTSSLHSNLLRKYIYFSIQVVYTFYVHQSHLYPSILVVCDVLVRVTVSSTLESAAPALSVPDVILESFRGRFWDNFLSWPNSDSELVPDNSTSASSTEPSPARSSADISTYLPTKGSHIVAFGFFTPIGNVIRYIITLISVLLLNFSDLSGSIWVLSQIIETTQICNLWFYGT